MNISQNLLAVTEVISHMIFPPLITFSLELYSFHYSLLLLTFLNSLSLLTTPLNNIFQTQDGNPL